MKFQQLNSLFIVGHPFVQTSRNHPCNGLFQVSLPGHFKSEEHSHVNKFSAILSPALVQHPQGPLPLACSGSCLYEFNRIFDSFRKLFPTGAGMYFPSCMSQNLALVILETVSGGWSRSSGQESPNKAGSGEVFSGVLLESGSLLARGRRLVPLS